MNYYSAVRLLTIVSLFIILQSCAIKGNFKGLYSYFNTTYKAKPELFSKEKWNCHEKNDNKVRIIRGKDIVKCLSQYSRSLVYIWSPNCTSDICYPLDEIQKYCNRQGIELFIVAEYYDAEKMTQQYTVKNPILAIDTEYYKTNITKRYVALFLKDIDFLSPLQNRYLLFEKGNFSREIYDIFNDEKLKLEEALTY
ncbi:hypothetical protein [Bergeyella zoohelcum]|uniref:Uncharacterized protein n=1 Tax=Bergeyella zoohelcum TaxID=1015 RepID=A0A376C250_9FLAO|nr:hypothetical protein [Bergeyella zoohelcum]EKB57049.1 hypothetical protein HMPREF9700_02266 [Bergeyella zoohelcum CCUG 30536]SSZ55595.1 Uncharacterised protein [Bergeyella zoohelcum]